MPFSDLHHDKILEGKTLYVVSDLHMGDGSQADNFMPYKSRFIEFLDNIVVPDPKGQLLIAGDTFEFWQSLLSSVVRTNFDLLRRLVDMGTLFIVGNHDVDLVDFVGMKVNAQFVELLRKQVMVQCNGKRILICHGHEFDVYNDPKRAMVLGRIAALVAGWLELKMGREIHGELTEDLLFRITMWLVKRLKAKFRPPSENQSRIPAYLEHAKKWKDEHEDIDIIIAGHTHLPGLFENWYFNLGSWQKDPTTYIRIDDSGPSLPLKFPGSEPIETNFAEIAEST